jgi:hypothetical protein
MLYSLLALGISMYDRAVLHPKKLNTVALVNEQTIPTEQPPLFGEVSANFLG